MVWNPKKEQIESLIDEVSLGLVSQESLSIAYRYLVPVGQWRLH